jgi:hypothetical protein
MLQENKNGVELLLREGRIFRHAAQNVGARERLSAFAEDAKPHINKSAKMIKTNATLRHRPSFDCQNAN